jgi:hypothetical protein
LYTTFFDEAAFAKEKLLGHDRRPGCLIIDCDRKQYLKRCAENGSVNTNSFMFSARALQRRPCLTEAAVTFTVLTTLFLSKVVTIELAGYGCYRWREARKGMCIVVEL